MSATHATRVIAALALCGAGGSAAGSWISIQPSTSTPAHNEVVTLDVVLDRGGVQGPFYAWQFADFRIAIASTGQALTPSAILPITASLSETAENVTSAGTVGASGGAWCEGRRPPQRLASSSFISPLWYHGGARFIGGEADLLRTPRRGADFVLASTENGGKIGGMQAPPALPDPNPAIHVGGTYEIFRFRFRYDAAFGDVMFRLRTVSGAVYTDASSAFATFQTTPQRRLPRTWIGGSPGSVVAPMTGRAIPGPGTLLAAGPMVLLASRRRR